MRRRIAGMGLGVVVVAAWWAWPAEAEAPAIAATPEASPIVFEPPVSPVPTSETVTIMRPELRALGYIDEEPDGPSVFCQLPDELSEGSDAVARGPGVRATGDLANGVLEVFIAEDAGLIEGTLRVAGVGTAELQITREDGCVVAAVERSAHVSGRVVATEGIDDGRVMVVGCGHRQVVDRDGGFYFATDPEPCTLVAMRNDGAFTLRSDSVAIDPLSDEEVLLDLNMPAFRAAGVGVRVEAHDLGISVSSVVDDTPASDAGLVAGDVIVALNGEDTVDFRLWDFVDAAVGPGGSDVTYTVLRDGEEVDITMRREQMERQPSW